MRRLLLVGLLVAQAHAFAPSRAAPIRVMKADRRVRVPLAAADGNALITLSAEEPIRVAEVLKKAWMEGGVKRGLVGTVIVGGDAEATVQIACQGDLDRLRSFADWIETSSMLVKSVAMVDAKDMPEASLTNRFPLAEAEAYSGGKTGSFAGELAEQLRAKSIQIKEKEGTTHSSDEGRA